MATESGAALREGLPANADLSAKQFFALKVVAGGKLDVCSAATDAAIGLLQNKPAAAGRAAEFIYLGISKAVSDGSVTAIVAGDRVGTDASGRLVKKATADFGVLGIALDGSTAQGTVIRVLVGAPATVYRALAG